MNELPIKPIDTDVSLKLFESKLSSDDIKYDEQYYLLLNSNVIMSKYLIATPAIAKVNVTDIEECQCNAINFCFNLVLPNGEEYSGIKTLMARMHNETVKIKRNNYIKGNLLGFLVEVESLYDAFSVENKSTEQLVS
ncbi:MAG TPA: hypothetical protein VLF63_02245 [Patescibacteria group bacterium]|nr:hypothetical protein [Patescibacteria group bacterium]